MDRDLALKLLSHAGVPWRVPTHSDYVGASHVLVASWTGSVLLVPDGRRGHDIGHELSHWLTAKPQHRCLPEYGLGTAPHLDVADADLVVRDPDDVEVATCILELRMVHQLNCLFGYEIDWRSLAHFYSFETRDYLGHPYSWEEFVAQPAQSNYEPMLLERGLWHPDTWYQIPALETFVP